MIGRPRRLQPSGRCRRMRQLGHWPTCRLDTSVDLPTIGLRPCLPPLGHCHRMHRPGRGPTGRRQTSARLPTIGLPLCLPPSGHCRHMLRHGCWTTNHLDRSAALPLVGLLPFLPPTPAVLPMVGLLQCRLPSGRCRRMRRLGLWMTCRVLESVVAVCGRVLALASLWSRRRPRKTPTSLAWSADCRSWAAPRSRQGNRGGAAMLKRRQGGRTGSAPKTSSWGPRRLRWRA